MNKRNFSPRRSRQSRHAFTLVEVLVALGILAILLVIIVLPLRLGFDSLNKGNAQTLTQSALQSTVTDMGDDIRQAVYVFPNSRVGGITDKAPYTDAPNASPAGGSTPYDARLPYYLSSDATDIAEPGKGAANNPNGIACGSSINWSNPSRLDMIQVRRDDVGNVLTPLAPSYNIVTYYARRQQLDKPYDPVDNPVVMYRAEYPAFGLFGTGANKAPRPLALNTPNNAFNAPIDFKRIFSGMSSAATECNTTDATATNRSSLWLSHNFYGEANLRPLLSPTPATDYDISSLNASYSQTLAIPRGLALEASNGYRAIPGYVPPTGETAQGALVPDTAFTTTDTNGDGKIDRVTISLGLASFEVGAQGQLDPVTNQPKGTVLRGTRTVDLPNVK